MSKNAITQMSISTNNKYHSMGNPYPESVTFFRENGYLNHETGHRNGMGHACQTYYISAQRDSFWHALRALRVLAMRKWTNQSPVDSVTHIAVDREFGKR